MCARTEILSHAHSAVAECDQWTGEAECREGKVYGSFPLVLAWGRVFGGLELGGAGGVLQFAFIKGAEWLGPLQCIQIKQC